MRNDGHDVHYDILLSSIPLSSLTADDQEGYCGCCAPSHQVIV